MSTGGSVGKASLTIVPKFDNLGRSVTNALNGINTTSSGVKMGQGLSNGIMQGTGGLVKSGALIGIFSAATSKAMDLIGSSVSGAVSRLDTLNNYPRVMQALGYSAEESEASISKMADHLKGLPTALNDMTSTVQGISAITGNLGKATDAGLALNDMLLAGGSSTALTSAAMEQFRQMLAKGVPEMQDWKSLTSAMPGQMSQLAKAMLGPTANANDLYEALGGNKNDPIFSMDQLMDKMIELDQNGGENITSFAEQAKNATGGIQTSMDNMQTAVSRGIAGVLEDIGTDTISRVFTDIGTGFENALKGIGGTLEEYKPYMLEFIGFMEEAGPAVAQGLGDVFDIIKPLIDDAFKAVEENGPKIAKGIGDAFNAAKPILSGVVDVVRQVGPAFIPAAAGVAGLAAAFKGLEVVSAISPLSKVQGVASKAGDAFMNLALKAKEGSAAQGLMLNSASALSSSIGGPLVLAATAAAAAIGITIGKYMDAQAKQETLTRATTGLKDAMNLAGTDGASGISDAYSAIESGSPTAKQSIRDVVDEVYNVIKAQAELADNIKQRNSDAAANIGMLDNARATIETYANKSGLSAEEQGKLAAAVQMVNDQCGTQWSVVDAANGKIADQNGAVQENTDKILANIDARKQQLQVEAAGENYKDAYKAKIDAEDALTQAKAKYNEEYQKAYDNNRAFMLEDEAKAAAELTMQDLGLAQAVDDASANLDGANEALGISEERLGTTASGAEAMRIKLDAMSDASEDVKNKIGGMAGSTEEFSNKLLEAGVSSEELSAISQEDFSAMLDSCGGDMNKLVGMIEVYNSAPVENKDGSINVDTSKLVDANGMVYTWNEKGELVDKNSNVAVNDISLQDSQNRVWVWNNGQLVPKETTANVFGNVPGGAAQKDVNDFNTTVGNMPLHKESTVEVKGNYQEATSTIGNLLGFVQGLGDKIVNITANYTQNGSPGSGQASGGIRLNAEGGIRYHAGGGIARKAVPLDIVGEAGAEAIVPLTNKAYVTPFAKTVAEQMDGTGQVINNYYSLSDLTWNSDDKITELFAQLIVELQQTNKMVRR